LKSLPRIFSQLSLFYITKFGLVIVAFLSFHHNSIIADHQESLTIVQNINIVLPSTFDVIYTCSHFDVSFGIPLSNTT